MYWALGRPELYRNSLFSKQTNKQNLHYFQSFEKHIKDTYKIVYFTLQDFNFTQFSSKVRRKSMWFFSSLPPPLPLSFLACVFIFSIVRKPCFDYEFKRWISQLIILPLKPWGPNETDPKGQPSAQLGYVNTSFQQVPRCRFRELAAPAEWFREVRQMPFSLSCCCHRGSCPRTSQKRSCVSMGPLQQIQSFQPCKANSNTT